jgi:ABC-type Na+ efflux pump permease subunit
MNKVYVVATTELGSAVRTKSFLIGLLLLPVLVGGSILIQLLVAKQVDTRPRPFAVVDPGGAFYQTIERAAAARNAALAGQDGKLTGPRFIPELATATSGSREELLLSLSDRVRTGSLFAFVEIPPAATEPTSTEPVALRYHSDAPNYNDLRSWLEQVIGAEIRARRFRAAGVDPALAARLERPASAEHLGLLARNAPALARGATASAGTIKAAEKVDMVRSFAVPAVLVIAMFLIVMASAPQLLNSVIEEKMSRISEVLLGSLTPFELMLGKLLGNVALALLQAILYLAAGLAMAAYHGYADALPTSLLGMFAGFLVLAVLLFGSLYMAVGSACSEIKDAQSLMMPVMILSMLPMFVWVAVVQNPSSSLSVGMSLFPPATPFLMLLRMALRPAPPIWQVGLSVVLTIATVVACVWAAGKIVRVGLLMQGKAPSFAELGRWVVAR